MKSPISIAQLDAINDAIAALQIRGHKDAAQELIAIWESEFAALKSAA